MNHLIYSPNALLDFPCCSKALVRPSKATGVENRSQILYFLNTCKIMGFGERDF